MVAKMNDNLTYKDKLKMVGIDTLMNDNEKIETLLNLYIEKENNLSDEILKFKSDKEKFEEYIEYIKKLSEELLVDYESKNQDLNNEINLLKQELASYQNNETRNMLMDQGFHEIADRFPRDQIAYLLLERSRLLDKIELRGSYNDNVNEYTDQVPNHIDELSVILNQVEHLENKNQWLEKKLKELSYEDYNEYMKNYKIEEKNTDALNVHNSARSYQTNSAPHTFSEAIERLAVAEIKASEADKLRDEVIKMHKILQQMNLNPNSSEEQKSKLNLDGSLSRQNNDMHKMLQSVDSQLKLLASNTDNQLNLDDKPELAMQLQKVQREFSTIKTELAKMIEKYAQQYKKYTEHKLQFKNNLFKTKELYKREHQKLRDQIEELKHKLELSRISLDKEIEVKENVERIHSKLMEEQKILTNQVIDLQSQNRKYQNENKLLKSRARSQEEIIS